VALPNFLIRIVSGVGIGFVGGYLIYWFMKRDWVPDNIVNAFALASAMLLFGATELIKPEAGLLAVTIAGLIVGLNKPRQLREVKAFKAEIVDLLIGLLFLLLVARLELQQFVDFFNAGGGWVLFSVILLIRPIGVHVSSWGTSLNIREKALLSWVAPRGVVAASMASLFALSLQSKGDAEGAALMESFVYSIICATVLIQGLSAGIVAKILRVQRPAPNDWVIIGAHHFGRELARQLIREDEQDVILLDTNARNIALARKEGLPALLRDGMEAEKLYEEEQTLFGTGYVLALTDNVELNQILMQRWAHELDNEKVFGWIPNDSPTKEDQLTGQSVFGDLSRPAVIGGELLQEESSFESVTWEEGMTLPSGDWHPLYIRRGKQLKAIPQDAALKELVKEEDEVICLRRSEGFLLRALQSGGYLTLECETIEQLYTQLAHVAAEAIEGISEETILEDLGAQGRVFPAFLGHGIAIPHVYSPDLNYRACYIASLKNGLEIPGQDEAIDFVFFLLSPTGDTEGHLSTLAEIAKSCHSEQRRKQLKAAQRVEDAIAVIGS
jgi:mannitol/fructose-specific phosphotransferase system IIA component (Ntr-type)